MNEKYTAETLDKIYLEYANLTITLTRKEIILAEYIKKLKKENAQLKAKNEKLKDNFDEMNYAKQVLKKLEGEK